MAPNKRGAAPAPGPARAPEDGSAAAEPYDYASGSVITKEEVEARGSGTRERGDTYDGRTLRSRLRCEVRVWWTGLMFLTRLPVPASIDHHPAFLMRSMMWFPIIGAAVGAWTGVWYGAAAVLWPAPPALAAALSTLADVWITGCFHYDGLADTIDGFGGGWARAQILRIMKDSRIGTYALVFMALFLHAKVSVLGLLGPGRAAAALVAAHCASRWSCLPLVYGCQYIQDEEDAKRGLYNWFAASKQLLTLPRLAWATATTLGVLWATLPAAQVAAVCATVLSITAASAYYGSSVLGGVVGDYLGATIAVCELAIYLVLAADWQAAAEQWQPLVLLAATAALPIVYTRRIINLGGGGPTC